jgi:hypothetical protein
MGWTVAVRGVRVCIQDVAAARHCDRGGGSRRDKDRVIFSINSHAEGAAR